MADKLRFGVIGVKGRGGRLAEEVAAGEKGAVVAVADLDEAACGEAAAKFGATSWTDYEAMLAAGDLDCAIIGTPHLLHAPMGLACLEAGLHTFIEKPIANTVSEADRLIEAARSRKLTLGIGHNYRTFPGNRAMKALIEAGELGDLHRVLWQWLDARPEAYYARDAWRGTWRASGGGVLMNQTSHDLDLMCWMIGEPVAVNALIGNWGHAFELEDTAVASIQFASGALANVQLSICDRHLNYRQVSGDRGTLEYRDGRANSMVPDELRIGRYDRTMREIIAGGQGTTTRPELAWETIAVEGDGRTPPIMDDFIDAVLEGRDPVTNGETARTTLELINGIVLSAVKGKTVEMPVDRGEYDDVFEALCRGDVRVKGLGG